MIDFIFFFRLLERKDRKDEISFESSARSLY